MFVSTPRGRCVMDAGRACSYVLHQPLLYSHFEVLKEITGTISPRLSRGDFQSLTIPGFGNASSFQLVRTPDSFSTTESTETTEKKTCSGTEEGRKLDRIDKMGGWDFQGLALDRRHAWNFHPVDPVRVICFGAGLCALCLLCGESSSSCSSSVVVLSVSISSSCAVFRRRTHDHRFERSKRSVHQASGFAGGI